jgi:hypothetical protein
MKRMVEAARIIWVEIIWVEIIWVEIICKTKGNAS